MLYSFSIISILIESKGDSNYSKTFGRSRQPMVTLKGDARVDGGFQVFAVVIIT